MLLNVYRPICPTSFTFFSFFSRSHIGKAILSQPACVSKLLSLLLDQRPSPKLVLIILQLCRAALPLMSVEDCGNVELPPWSYSVPSLNSEQEDPSDPASKIASLLLAKLADYVVPGERLAGGWYRGACFLWTATLSFLLSVAAAAAMPSVMKEREVGEGRREIPKPEFSLRRGAIPITLQLFCLLLKDVRQFFLQLLLNLILH